VNGRPAGDVAGQAVTVTRPDDPLALAEVLSTTAGALHASESGDRDRAFLALTEAAVLADGAYPDGSPGQIALGYLFGSIASEIAAAGGPAGLPAGHAPALDRT
jgi:hypothetical protein